MNLQEINVFGGSGFNGKVPSIAPSSTMDNTISEVLSNDLKSFINKGYNNFRIQSSENNMTPANDMIEKSINEKTGVAKATLFIIGYIK